MKQLDKLLFEQGGACFFCKSPLEKADASIEHLYAQANGGTNAEENLVACCKALNALLGNKPLKEKFQIVLRQRGPFRCPVEGRRVPAVPIAVAQANAPALSAGPGRMNAASPKPAPPKLVSNKTVDSKGSRPSALAVFASVSSVQCPTCKHRVPAAVGQSEYVCPHCRGAFRY